MEDFDLDVEFERVMKAINSEEFYILKRNLYNNSLSSKEYKKITRLNNIKKNLHFLKNIMDYIKDLENEIREMQKEKEERKKYGEFQAKEKYLDDQIKKDEAEVRTLKATILLEELEQPEIDFIKEQIEDSIKEIERMKRRIIEIKKHNAEFEQHEKKYKYSYEEQREIILHLREKIRQYSIVAEKLIRGHTWNEALEYLLSWQKEKYKLNKTDRITINNDINKIKEDEKIGNEIVKIAYNYDEMKREER